MTMKEALKLLQDISKIVEALPPGQYRKAYNKLNKVGLYIKKKK